MARSHGTPSAAEAISPAPACRSITDSLSPDSVPVASRLWTYHQPEIATAIPAATAPARAALAVRPPLASQTNSSATAGAAVRNQALVRSPKPKANPRPAAQRIRGPSSTSFSPSQSIRVNNATDRQSLPTRATSSAHSGIRAAIAAHPSATRISAKTARANR